MQYSFRRLVFGLTSSPAILNGTIEHHLSHYKQPEPQVSELLANSLYVDEFPGGGSDDESAIHACLSKGKGHHERGKFQPSQMKSEFKHCKGKDQRRNERR